MEEGDNSESPEWKDNSRKEKQNTYVEEEVIPIWLGFS